MNVFGKYFEYDGVSSDIYNVILCSFEEVGNTRETGINYDFKVKGETIINNENDLANIKQTLSL